MPRILIVRGHQATPWELHPWTLLPARFDVSLLSTSANGYEIDGLRLERIPVRARRDRLPRGRIGDLLARAIGDRYVGNGAERAFAGADIVHAEELSYWFSADAARRRSRGGFRLVQTVWETLPLGQTYRNGAAKRWREEVLQQTDLFLPATRRAHDGLLLEGVEGRRIKLCSPGVDIDRFAERAADPPTEHVVLSAGRLVWEKGHHDVIRAVAALHHGHVTGPGGERFRPRLMLTGSGAEATRLRDYAAELGIADDVTFARLPYAEMPATFARASAMVLASLPSAGVQLHPFDMPRAFWEEQFGMVLAEAMASGLDIVATTTGAIPEVLGGQGTLVAPGDWMGIARALAAGPLLRPPGERVAYPRELVERYSSAAMAARLAEAYDRVLGESSRSSASTSVAQRSQE